MRFEQGVLMSSVLARLGDSLLLSPAFALDICPDIVVVKPIELEFHNPVLVDAFIPQNTDIIINNGLVIHVTDAPVTLSTVVTDISTSFTTVKSTASDNSFTGPYTTITVTDGTDSPHTRSYPPNNAGSSGIVIVQVPSFTRPYTTTTITDSTGGPTTGAFAPNPTSSTGTGVVRVPSISMENPSPSTPAANDQSSGGFGTSMVTGTDVSSGTDTAIDTGETTAAEATTEITTTQTAATETTTDTTTPTSVLYESCPDSLYRSVNCCSVDVIGVADIECDTPTKIPTDAHSFSNICASVGKRARCCVLPLLGQALVCMTPVGVAN
ncbi:unnamed protein product [Clonostachys chloroleuca]|uniref:Cryparin n=1 Tax=Clonostachys chloroleuca TaxID=1926264 RepID=A0AA35MEV1_9HYPO|nr:unnamed protein product [Clonostachys chloroleuca]